MNERQRRVLSIALLVGWLASTLGVHGLHDCRFHGPHPTPEAMAGDASSEAQATHVCAFHPRAVRTAMQRSIRDLDANRSGTSAKLSSQVEGLPLHGGSSHASGCLACSYLALAALGSVMAAPAACESVAERGCVFSRGEAPEPLAGAVVPRGPPAIL